jgi:hypothetical protein
MIVEMRKNSPQREINDVVMKAQSLGFSVQLNLGPIKP